MPPPPAEPDVRRGVVAALTAYLIWGLSPLFWKQLGDVEAVDTVAWRILFTAVTVGALVAVTSRGELAAAWRDRTTLVVAATTGALLGVNWGVYVWAVSAERVVEASLGYFMNPLVSVFLGVVFLRERLRRGQWAAVALAGLGVAWLTITLGSLPWVPILLALTFGLYGLVRKVAAVGPAVGLTLETWLMFVPAAVLLLVRSSGPDVDLVQPPATMLLLASTGLVTAVPLVLFAAAARRVPLSMVGLAQYLTPTLQFLIGLFVYDEPFDRTQLVGYTFIWIGLAVFVVDAMRAAGNRRVDAATRAAASTAGAADRAADDPAVPPTAATRGTDRADGTPVVRPAAPTGGTIRADGSDQPTVTPAVRPAAE
jgi:chloramphenicol-sensitive protein RarD